MSLETEYLGHKISYSENEDVWRCWDLNLEGKSLSAVKGKIAKVNAAARKIDRVEAFLIESWGRNSLVTVLSWADKTHLWVMDGKRRSKAKCAHIALDTPETRDALKQSKEMRAQADALRQQADQIVATIPRWEPAATNVADETEVGTIP